MVYCAGRVSTYVLSISRTKKSGTMEGSSPGVEEIYFLGVEAGSQGMEV